MQAEDGRETGIGRRVRMSRLQVRAGCCTVGQRLCHVRFGRSRWRRAHRGQGASDRDAHYGHGAHERAAPQPRRVDRCRRQRQNRARGVCQYDGQADVAARWQGAPSFLSSPHLTSPTGPVEGVYPLERLPGTLWCCAVLQGARQLPLHGSKGVGSRLPGCIRLQPPTHREGRSPDPLGSVVWGQWRAVAGAVPWPRPTAQQ